MKRELTIPETNKNKIIRREKENNIGSRRNWPKVRSLGGASVLSGSPVPLSRGRGTRRSGCVPPFLRGFTYLQIQYRGWSTRLPEVL